MNKNVLKQQLIRELDEISIPELFQAYNPENHIFSRHYHVSEKEMKARIRKAPMPEPGSMLLISRFTGTREEIITLVIYVLRQNLDEIIEEFTRNPYGLIEICGSFERPIGEGIAKGTDWNRLFSMSNLRLVIKASDIRGRLFQIVTGYPELAICGILVFASILIVVACINAASSKGREREAEDLEQLENIRKQKKK